MTLKGTHTKAMNPKRTRLKSQEDTEINEHTDNFNKLQNEKEIILKRDKEDSTRFEREASQSYGKSQTSK
jgi:hypothetical protein